MGRVERARVPEVDDEFDLPRGNGRTDDVLNLMDEFGVRVLAANMQTGNLDNLNNDLFSETDGASVELGVEIERATQVNVIGDLDGNIEVLRASLITLGLAKFDHKNVPTWIGGNQVLIVLGDLLADRGHTSFEAMGWLRKLNKEAALQGGKIIHIAGNHEDFARCFLTGEATADGKDVFAYNQKEGLHGLVEFFQFSSDLEIQRCASVEEFLAIVANRKTGYSSSEITAADIKDIFKFGGKIDKITSGEPMATIRRDILTEMQKKDDGRLILEQMCEMELVSFRDGILYFHTDPSPEILRLFADTDRSIDETIQIVNDAYRTDLEARLGINNSILPDGFKSFRIPFLNSRNRTSEKKYAELEEADYFVKLEEKGVKCIVHGHTQVRKSGGAAMHETRNGIKIFNVNLMAGRNVNDTVIPNDKSIMTVSQQGVVRTGNFARAQAEKKAAA